MHYSQSNNESTEKVQQRNKSQNNESNSGESSFLPSVMASTVGNYVSLLFRNTTLK